MLFYDIVKQMANEYYFNAQCSLVVHAFVCLYRALYHPGSYSIQFHKPYHSSRMTYLLTVRCKLSQSMLQITTSCLLLWIIRGAFMIFHLVYV